MEKKHEFQVMTNPLTGENSFVFNTMAPLWAQKLCDGERVVLVSYGEYDNALLFTKEVEE